MSESATVVPTVIELSVELRECEPGQVHQGQYVQITNPETGQTTGGILTSHAYRLTGMDLPHTWYYSLRRGNSCFDVASSSRVQAGWPRIK